jgi:hypothetical protein
MRNDLADKPDRGPGRGYEQVTISDLDFRNFGKEFSF